MIGIGQNGVRVIGEACLVKTYQISHQAYEDQIYGPLRGLSNRENAAVILAVKIAETVNTAARKENLYGICGVGPF